MPQDLPPAGGYDAVQYKRNIPVRGLRPVWYLVGVGVIMAYGWRKVFIGNREKKYVSDIPLGPVLSFSPQEPGRAPYGLCANHYVDAKKPPTYLSTSIPPSLTAQPACLTSTVLSSELGREKIWSRIHITPLLQAEEDRDQVRRYYADQAREKALLGSTSSPYNSDRFVRPTVTYSPANVTRD